MQGYEQRYGMIMITDWKHFFFLGTAFLMAQEQEGLINFYSLST